MWHSGWFGELGDLLSSPEYCIRVSAPDLISHGLSDDVVPGYRNYLPDFAAHADEVRAAISRARAALPPSAPVFLLGECMGGLAAIQHLVVHGTDVDGLILCGTLVQLSPALLPPRAMIPVLRGVAWLFPTMPVPGQDIEGDTFDRAFGDPEVGPAARDDPLVGNKEPPRLGYMVGALDAMSLAQKEGHKIQVKSVLMMHYKEDERVFYEGAKNLVDSMEVDDKVCIPLEGYYHQIFQDTPEKSREYGETVAKFITERAT